VALVAAWTGRSGRELIMTAQHVGFVSDRADGGERDRLVRGALKLDAAASGAAGVLSLVAGPVLDGVLGLPLALLWPAGLVFIGWAASLWLAASRAEVSRPVVWSVIVLNLVYVAASVVVVAAGWFSLTTAGIAFMLVQAAAVAVFAELQFLGLRRLQPAAT
jgi:hypothetical protein